jgi:hypothetical protein
MVAATAAQGTGWKETRRHKQMEGIFPSDFLAQR